MKKRFAILLLTLFSLVCFSQKWVKGRVTDKHNVGLKLVHIKTDFGATVSQSNGVFLFSVPDGAATCEIGFSHVGFHTKRQTLVFSERDTLVLNIKLASRVYQLNPMQLSEVREPEPVFHSSLHYVHDFEILENRLLLITFNRSLKKDPVLTLANFDEEIVSELPLSMEPIGLFKDFTGRIFVEFKSNVKLIFNQNDSLALLNVDLKEYFHSVKPCKDSVNQQILFSDQVWYLSRFNYYSFDVSDSLVFLLKNVVHPKVNHMMRWEYYDMRIDDQRKARKMAQLFPELDAQEVAGLMTGFQNTIFYEEPYAPIFVKKDTILLFDHHSDYVFRFTESLETIDSIPIDYHKPPKRSSWKRQMFYDKGSDVFYALFNQNGYSYLKEVDMASGGVKRSNKLQNQFVEKIRVYNQYAYYIYKEPSSPSKPFIYRELLSIAD